MDSNGIRASSSSSRTCAAILSFPFSNGVSGTSLSHPWLKSERSSNASGSMPLHIVSWNPTMPFHNARRHHGPACSLILLTLVATLVVPAAGATESVPRACDEMSFRVIAQMMDAASDFETRLVLLGKSLAQERSAQHLA